MSEFQQRLMHLFNVYRVVLPPTIYVGHYQNKHLEVYLDYPPVVIHNCLGCQTVSANRMDLIVGEQQIEPDNI